MVKANSDSLSGIVDVMFFVQDTVMWAGIMERLFVVKKYHFLLSISLNWTQDNSKLSYFDSSSAVSTKEMPKSSV